MKAVETRYVIQMYKSMYSDTKNLAGDAIEELEELERLAEIGKAILKAFEKKLFVVELVDYGYDPYSNCDHQSRAYDVDELLEWYKSNEGV